MKTLKITFLFALAVLLFTNCSNPDDGPGPQPPIDGGEDPDPVNPTVNPADYLIDGIAFLETNNPDIPYIIYHTSGAKTAMIDDDDDGFHEIMVHSEENFETVMVRDEQTGLPYLMTSSDGTVALYNFKENNTLLDLAILRPGETVEYFRDLTSNLPANAARDANNSNGSACNIDPLNVTLNGVGYSWKLGGLCEIRDGNGGESQFPHLDVRSCRNLFRSIHGGLQSPVNEENACKQLENQVGVLGLIPGYANCATAGNLSTCIAQGIIEMEDLIDNADDVYNAIGNDNISSAFGALISGYGDVKVTLTWNTTSDIDLWVTEPDGNAIFYGNPISSSGGLLDFDDVDGYGPENIFWKENPPIGAYLVQVHYYQDNGEGITDYTVQIEVDGNVEVFEGTLDFQDQVNDIATFTINSAGKSTHITKRAKSILGERKSIKD